MLRNFVHETHNIEAEIPTYNLDNSICGKLILTKVGPFLIDEDDVIEIESKNLGEVWYMLPHVE